MGVKSVACMLLAWDRRKSAQVGLPAASGRKPVATRHVANGRSGDRDAELAKFADDPQ